jgi:hypothetical protein
LAPSVFPIAEPPPFRWRWFYALPGLVLVVPLLLASDLWLWLLLVTVPVAVVMALLTMMVLRGRRVRFELDDESLRISGSLYGRAIPRAVLRVAEASVINIEGHAKFGQMFKTNGIDLPNYCSGWFCPRGGGNALLFVTDRTRVVVVPTTAGYELLLSPEDPDGFLEALQAEVE